MLFLKFTFGLLNAKNVTGKISNNSHNKIDTSPFVQKPYLRTKYIRSNTEEDIDFKNQYSFKNLIDPISFREAAEKNYADTFFNHRRVLKNTAQVGFNENNLDNFRLVKLNPVPGVEEHLTAKYYVDQAIPNSLDEPALLKKNLDNDFNNYNIKSISLNTEAVNDSQVITKSYVDEFLQENYQSR